MTVSEFIKLVTKIAILQDVAEKYPSKTIENIIAQIKARN